MAENRASLPRQSSGQFDGPGKPPTVKTTFDQEPGGPFPRELYAPADEGPIIRPKSTPKVVREDG